MAVGRGKWVHHDMKYFSIISKLVRIEVVGEKINSIIPRFYHTNVKRTLTIICDPLFRLMEDAEDAGAGAGAERSCGELLDPESRLEVD